MTLVVHAVEHEEDLYVRSTNGTLIRQRWFVIYEWFAGKFSKEWVDQMARLVAARERYSKW